MMGDPMPRKIKSRMNWMKLTMAQSPKNRQRSLIL
jgi:hypothetical protein